MPAALPFAPALPRPGSAPRQAARARIAGPTPAPQPARAGTALSLVPIGPRGAAGAAAVEPAEAVPACGWLESSLDLRQGLLVLEHEQPDALQAWLPWHWWLRWALDEPAPSVR
jgi:hypothetical protein